jgi:hypothetical protein
MANKRRLFTQGVAATTIVFGTADLYACPLCGKFFAEDALKSGELTAEDVPPKALGGKVIILTCKPCNNTAGHSIDAEAFRRLQQKQYAQALLGDRKGYAGRGTIRVGDVGVQVDLHVDADNTRELRIVPKSNNPKDVAQFEKALEAHIAAGTTDGLELKFTGQVKSVPRLAPVSDLRAAYLACTAALGYSFGMHQVLRPVREQILDPEREVLRRWWLRLQQPQEPNTLLFSDVEGMAIVNLPHASIMLPSPSRPPERFNELMDSLVEKRPFSMTGFAALPWPSSFEARLDHARGAGAEESS